MKKTQSLQVDLSKPLLPLNTKIKDLPWHNEQPVLGNQIHLLVMTLQIKEKELPTISQCWNWAKLIKADPVLSNSTAQELVGAFKALRKEELSFKHYGVFRYEGLEKILHEYRTKEGSKRVRQREQEEKKKREEILKLSKAKKPIEQFIKEIKFINGKPIFEGRAMEVFQKVKNNLPFKYKSNSIQEDLIKEYNNLKDKRDYKFKTETQVKRDIARNRITEYFKQKQQTELDL